MSRVFLGTTSRPLRSPSRRGFWTIPITPGPRNSRDGKFHPCFYPGTMGRSHPGVRSRRLRQQGRGAPTCLTEKVFRNSQENPPLRDFGSEGFEPSTSWTPSKRTTKLCYDPSRVGNNPRCRDALQERIVLTCPFPSFPPSIHSPRIA